jgi:hypothetical protein
MKANCQECTLFREVNEENVCEECASYIHSKQIITPQIPDKGVLTLEALRQQVSDMNKIKQKWFIMSNPGVAEPLKGVNPTHVQLDVPADIRHVHSSAQVFEPVWLSTDFATLELRVIADMEKAVLDGSLSFKKAMQVFSQLKNSPERADLFRALYSGVGPGTYSMGVSPTGRQTFSKFNEQYTKGEFLDEREYQHADWPTSHEGETIPDEISGNGYVRGFHPGTEKLTGRGAGVRSGGSLPEWRLGKASGLLLDANYDATAHPVLVGGNTPNPNGGRVDFDVITVKSLDGTTRTYPGRGRYIPSTAPIFRIGDALKQQLLDDILGRGVCYMRCYDENGLIITQLPHKSVTFHAPCNGKMNYFAVWSFDENTDVPGIYQLVVTQAGKMLWQMETDKCVREPRVIQAGCSLTMMSEIKVI